MPSAPLQPELTPAVRQALDAVRRRIRTYVWLEGIAILVAVLGLAFWLGMAADWFFEPGAPTRQLALAAVGCFAAFVAYRYLVRRVFVPISDSTAAVLLERRFALQDHLITAVDMGTAPPHAAPYHPELVSQTVQAAEAAVADIDTRELFNQRPLRRAAVAAATLVVSIVAFALLSPNTFGFWLHRIALSNEPWPRRVHLEVVGFAPDATGRRTHKLAQDDDFELLVHADTRGYEVPDEVEIRFRLADGRRGRDTMIRVGNAESASDDYQTFRYEFKQVASDMEFDIVGGDDRVRGLELQVVDRPELFAIELECHYPEYLHRPARRLPVTGGMRIPEGTQLVLHASSTKPLTAVSIHTTKDKNDARLAFAQQPPDKLQWEYGKLSADDVLLVHVTDTDQVATREPYRVSLSAVKDEVPQVAVRLSGISTAITPDAVLPLVGKVTDDYGLARVWYEYQVDGGASSIRPLAERTAGEPSVDKFTPFDLRNADSGERLLLKPKQRLTLTLKAADLYDLAPAQAATKSERAGSSQQFALDVVTPADLLALLERRELALRQRFESLYEKLTDTRNLLNRVVSDDTNADAAPATPAATDGAAPNGEASVDAASSAQRMLSRRRLRVAGSLQNVVQAADEIAGVADAFDDLSEELTNNRIDNPDLKSRLGEQIARPLHQIAEQRMPKLAAELKLAEEQLAEPAAMAPQLRKAIALADQILVEMRQVLDRMLELETYNEVVALLRGIITDQEEINRRTKERQKDRLRDLFEN